jgi:hypothetical protein
MLYNDYKKSLSRFDPFAMSDSLGHYDFCTSIICLESISTNDIEKLRTIRKQFKRDKNGPKLELDLDSYNQLSRILPLASHEYTHFIDATSTLWGHRHLMLMNLAYSSNPERFEVAEEEYSNAKSFYDHIRSIKLPDYYTTIYAHDDNRPWEWRPSIGLKFDKHGKISDYPIPFCTFFNRQKQILARSPISACSILEASAMSQEIIQKVNLCLQLPNGVKDVELAQLNKDTINYIYNKNLTEYSACAHLIANYQTCTDVILAYRLCFVISRFVLNFPQKAYEQLSEEPKLDYIFAKFDHEMLTRIRAGLKHHDLGVLFYFLIFMMPVKDYQNDAELFEGICSVLKELNFDIDEIKKQADKEIKELNHKLQDSPLEGIKAIANAGYENYLSINWSNSSLKFNELHSPPLLLNDENQINIFGCEGNMLHDLDLNDLYNELIYGQIWIEKFSEACS